MRTTTASFVVLLLSSVVSGAATVTGHVGAPNGLPDRTPITFQYVAPAVSEDSGFVIIPKKVTVVPNIVGTFSTNLIGGHYVVSAPVLAYSFKITVPSTNATYDWLTLTTNVVTFVFTNVPLTFVYTNNVGGVVYSNTTFVTNTVYYTNGVNGTNGLDVMFPITNSVTISGTNVTVDLSIGNAFTLTLNGTNAYVRATNSAPMRWARLEIVQGSSLTNTVLFNTNYTQPTIFGQTLTMPTNTAFSRQWVDIQGDSEGNTNTIWQTIKP